MSRNGDRRVFQPSESGPMAEKGLSEIGEIQMKPDTGSLATSSLVYLSLGSNVGERAEQLSDAQSRLSVAGRTVAASSLYETEPVEFTEQPWFLNCVVALETSQTPGQLMASLLRIEEEMGRRRVQKKGPRSIDIDILLFGDTILNSQIVTIPHPAMHQRRFVLEPLAEIAPDVQHPVFKKTIRELREALPAGQAVRRMPRPERADD